MVQFPGKSLILQKRNATISCELPSGAICLVSIYGTQHNPAVWTNPHVRTPQIQFLFRLELSLSDTSCLSVNQEFDPHRFDPEHKKSVSSHAFIPFSSGPRSSLILTDFKSQHALAEGVTCTFLQELHRSEVCHGWASGCGGADSAEVPPPPGSEPWARGQPWPGPPPPPAGATGRRRTVVTAGPSGPRGNPSMKMMLQCRPCRKLCFYFVLSWKLFTVTF